jgi:hypothetical protein
MPVSSFADVDVELDAIKKVLNNVQVAITNLGSKAQLRQLTLLMQKDIEDLQARVASLEANVILLQQKF